MSKKAQHRLGSVHCWAPPTLLEDGQCYRGDQLKQGFDGGEVLGLDGEDVQHLKRQDVTAGTHWVSLPHKSVLQEEMSNGIKQNDVR